MNALRGKSIPSHLYNRRDALVLTSLISLWELYQWSSPLPVLPSVQSSMTCLCLETSLLMQTSRDLSRSHVVFTTCDSEVLRSPSRASMPWIGDQLCQVLLFIRFAKSPWAPGKNLQNLTALTTRTSMSSGGSCIAWMFFLEGKGRKPPGESSSKAIHYNAPCEYSLR